MLPLEREVFSPAIYPGTNFMFELNRQLEYFVQYKINTDPMYKRVSFLAPINISSLSWRWSSRTQVCQARVSIR
jgi:hypothetical protein